MYKSFIRRKVLGYCIPKIELCLFLTEISFCY